MKQEVVVESLIGGPDRKGLLAILRILISIQWAEENLGRVFIIHMAQLDTHCQNTILATT